MQESAPFSYLKGVRNRAETGISVNRPLETTDRTGIMSDAADNPYLRDAVLTASPEQLHLMLYDGAIRFALQGRDAILKKDFAVSYERLTRAQNILAEMQAGLDYDVNRELCERMASIYNFLYRKLVDANVNRNVQDIDDSVRVLRIERETWQLLVDKVNIVRQDAVMGTPDAPETGTFGTVNVEG